MSPRFLTARTTYECVEFHERYQRVLGIWPQLAASCYGRERVGAAVGAPIEWPVDPGLQGAAPHEPRTFIAAQALATASTRALRSRRTRRVVAEIETAHGVRRKPPSAVALADRKPVS